ncbi:Hypothetical protein FKW44_024224 [Caligus rogercresseyi]|uniref:Uncharacterized protein n=1 Tax=Caligus rogercresseyi TaxID=217165 RepID=A0A7T8JUB2_CALRO|nr:Hypothetical protein FKW44_024713 [Caligus rogercresseyi]QQP33007.1 Hypothetical protein FKW44_024224 [Caligus rogercresseyi]
MFYNDWMDKRTRRQHWKEFADPFVKDGARRGTPVSVPVSLCKPIMLFDKRL